MLKAKPPRNVALEEKRSSTLVAASVEVLEFARPFAERGFYGQVRLELELQDGVVMVVRAGVEEVMKIRDFPAHVARKSSAA